MSDTPDPGALFRLDGRVAIVTGASSGLGHRFARVLHAAGAIVVAAARRTDRLDALALELGERIVPVTCDVTDTTQVEALVERAVGPTGRIDVLVNNAGYGRPAAAETESLDHLRRTLEVNLVGGFDLTQQVARHMLVAGSGSIINVASVLGLVAGAPVKHASYCTSKGAVVNLTRQLGCEWARRGVRVNAIAPGWFETEMTRDEMFEAESGQRFIATHCPMGRGGAADELDGVLLFLAGEGSRYMTGQVVAVDGGWTAR